MLFSRPFRSRPTVRRSRWTAASEKVDKRAERKEDWRADMKADRKADRKAFPWCRPNPCTSTAGRNSQL